MARATYRESSDSRNDFQAAYSTLSKILARSRGLASSVKLSKLNSLGLAADDERGVRRRGHAGDHLQQADVLGVAAELVVADQHPVRLAAELAVLFLVDLLEQRALVELDGLLQVLEQLLLLDVQDPDLEGRRRSRTG